MKLKEYIFTFRKYIQLYILTRACIMYIPTRRTHTFTHDVRIYSHTTYAYIHTRRTHLFTHDVRTYSHTTYAPIHTRRTHLFTHDVRTYSCIRAYMYLHVLAPDDKRQRISLSFTDMRISRVMASKKCMRYISLMNSRHESRRQQRYIIRSQLIGRCFFDL